jgi:hypothetical protein
MSNTHKAICLFQTLLTALLIGQTPPAFAASPESLPAASEYIGEIRRGPDGKLTATAPESSERTAGSPLADPRDGSPKTIHVGRFQQFQTIAAAAKVARNGDTVEIDAGDYVGDVAIWDQDKLTIKGIGGPVRLIANGRHVERKGIWIVRGGKITVENIEFSGARVEHQNGAGIRFEKGHLTLRNCAFFDNENGIMTHNDETTELDIENSEFGRNGHGNGQTHNIYVGSIKRFRMTGSYSHHANGGQLVKSRARESYILYNRLTDETGRASYEIDLPNGGIAYVIGNIIQQSPNATNGHMISFGVEGYKWDKNELYLVNNTIIDNRPANGRFLLLKPGPGQIRAVNNILYGPDTLNPADRPNSPPTDIQLSGSYENNLRARLDDFTNPAKYDYTLKPDSKLRTAAVNPGTAHNFALGPKQQYLHPLKTIGLKKPAAYPGAIQIEIRDNQ